MVTVVRSDRCHSDFEVGFRTNHFKRTVSKSLQREYNPEAFSIEATDQ
jgi:hypothetical protein